MRNMSIKSSLPLLPLVLLALVTGCPQYRDPRVPEPILRRTEPVSGEGYLIYTPSTYDAELAHPLIVVCHGTPPWDTPIRQIRDWVRLAEEKGFIVAAPELEGTRAEAFLSAEKQIRRQEHDESVILNTVRSIRGSHNISDTRIFLAGWSAGGYAVLYTGLKHPGIFRAIAVLQGNFDPVYVAPVAEEIDPHQSVFVLYSPADVLTGSAGKACVEWLLEHGARVYDERTSGAHRGHPGEACNFFERVVRTMPWLRIRAIQSADEPLTVRFGIRASFEPESFAWSFGDSTTSPIARPTHTYRRGGTYRVSLTARTPQGAAVRRTVEVTVGSGRPTTESVPAPT